MFGATSHAVVLSASASGTHVPRQLNSPEHGPGPELIYGHTGRYAAAQILDIKKQRATRPLGLANPIVPPQRTVREVVI